MHARILHHLTSISKTSRRFAKIWIEHSFFLRQGVTLNPEFIFISHNIPSVEFLSAPNSGFLNVVEWLTEKCTNLLSDNQSYAFQESNMIIDPGNIFLQIVSNRIFCLNFKNMLLPISLTDATPGMHIISLFSHIHMNPRKLLDENSSSHIHFYPDSRYLSLLIKLVTSSFTYKWVKIKIWNLLILLPLKFSIFINHFFPLRPFNGMSILNLPFDKNIHSHSNSLNAYLSYIQNIQILN